MLVEEVTTAQIPQDPELVDLAQALLKQIQQIPTGSQILHHVQNSAISNSGTANNYNIQGDQSFGKYDPPPGQPPDIPLPPKPKEHK